MLADDAARAACGSGSDVLLLHEQHILDASSGEMVGDATTVNASSDDHDIRDLVHATIIHSSGRSLANILGGLTNVANVASVGGLASLETRI
jgi:hypothetical protein